MSQGVACKCPERAKPTADRAWSVVQYKCNHSAFSGYHETDSDYSAVQCSKCDASWRTKAKYVERLRGIEAPANLGRRLLSKPVPRSR